MGRTVSEREEKWSGNRGINAEAPENAETQMESDMGRSFKRGIIGKVDY
jgi:hypothetical protein